MPTYDYACRECGATYEVIHAMTEDGPSVCERCGGSLRRVLYPAGIIFKGSGFYRTDSRAASNGGSASSGDAKAADGASKGSTSDGGGSAKPASESSSSTPAAGSSAAD